MKKELVSGAAEPYGERLLACREMMYRIAFGVLQSEEDASDAVQNAFCSLLSQGAGREKLEKAKPKLFRWYVCQTAKNAAVDLYRKRQREADRFSGAEEEDPCPDGGGDPAGRLIRQERKAALRRAVNGLPEKTRAVMIRVLVLGEKESDVAASLGISCQAVSARLKRGKELLAARMQQEEDQ